MGPIGVQEMFAIVVLALLLFGPKKLPELARLLGKGLSEFRRAKNELKTTLETHMNELDREVRASEFNSQPKQLGRTASSYSPVSYPYSYEDSAPYEAPVSRVTPESSSTTDMGLNGRPKTPLTPAVEGTVARSAAPQATAPAAGAEADRPA